MFDNVGILSVRACMHASVAVLATLPCRCVVEPRLDGVPAETRYQFEREGYFCVDRDSGADGLVFNRTVGLRESWPREA